MTCWASDGMAWKIDGKAQALVSLGLTTPLVKKGTWMHLGYLEKMVFNV